jgi:hypothetical protein
MKSDKHVVLLSGVLVTSLQQHLASHRSNLQITTRLIVVQQAPDLAVMEFGKWMSRRFSFSRRVSLALV